MTPNFYLQVLEACDRQRYGGMESMWPIIDKLVQVGELDPACIVEASSGGGKGPLLWHLLAKSDVLSEDRINMIDRWVGGTGWWDWSGRGRDETTTIAEQWLGQNVVANKKLDARHLPAIKALPAKAVLAWRGEWRHDQGKHSPGGMMLAMALESGCGEDMVTAILDKGAKFQGLYWGEPTALRIRSTTQWDVYLRHGGDPSAAMPKWRERESGPLWRALLGSVCNDGGALDAAIRKSLDKDPRQTRAIAIEENDRYFTSIDQYRNVSDSVSNIRKLADWPQRRDKNGRSVLSVLADNALVGRGGTWLRALYALATTNKAREAVLSKDSEGRSLLPRLLAACDGNVEADVMKAVLKHGLQPELDNHGVGLLGQMAFLWKAGSELARPFHVPDCNGFKTARMWLAGPDIEMEALRKLLSDHIVNSSKKNSYQLIKSLARLGETLCGDTDDSFPSLRKVLFLAGALDESASLSQQILAGVRSDPQIESVVAACGKAKSPTWLAAMEVQRQALEAKARTCALEQRASKGPGQRVMRA